MEPVTVVSQRHVGATPEQTFDAVVPIDLTTVFTGYGPFPAVIDVRDQPGAWDETAAGKSRTVVVSGGGFMRERAVHVERPASFEYEVVPTKGPLVWLVNRINGRFAFAADDHGTQITWTYDFVPRKRSRPLLRVLAPLWARYARRILDGCAEEVARHVSVAASAGAPTEATPPAAFDAAQATSPAPPAD